VGAAGAGASCACCSSVSKSCCTGLATVFAGSAAAVLSVVVPVAVVPPDVVPVVDDPLSALAADDPRELAVSEPVVPVLLADVPLPDELPPRSDVREDMSGDIMLDIIIMGIIIIGIIMPIMEPMPPMPPPAASPPAGVAAVAGFAPPAPAGLAGSVLSLVFFLQASLVLGGVALSPVAGVCVRSAMAAPAAAVEPLVQLLLEASLGGGSSAEASPAVPNNRVHTAAINRCFFMPRPRELNVRIRTAALLIKCNISQSTIKPLRVV